MQARDREKLIYFFCLETIRWALVQRNYDGFIMVIELTDFERSLFHSAWLAWKDIASAKTDEYGKYSVVWKAFHGYYEVKATWTGNSNYPETSVSVNLNVKPFGNLITEFSSNSTITNMNFNSTTRVLSFSAEGQSGTTGYVNIILEKDPTFNPQSIIVLLDGHPINYNMESTGQSWILEFTYTHSIHDVIVNLDASTAPPLERQSEPEPFPTLLVVAVIVTVAAVVAVVLFVLKKRKSKVG